MEEKNKDANVEIGISPPRFLSTTRETCSHVQHTRRHILRAFVCIVCTHPLARSRLLVRRTKNDRGRDLNRDFLS